MDKQPQSRTPLIIAIVLLLLPVLYVGSYAALVEPSHSCVSFTYRCGHLGTSEAWLTRIYCPLEEIDFRLRPAAWGVTPRIIIVEEDEERLGIDFEDS